MEVCGHLQASSDLPPGKEPPVHIRQKAVARRKESLHCLRRESNSGRQVRNLVLVLKELP